MKIRLRTVETYYYDTAGKEKLEKLGFKFGGPTENTYGMGEWYLVWDQHVEIEITTIEELLQLCEDMGCNIVVSLHDGPHIFIDNER